MANAHYRVQCAVFMTIHWQNVSPLWKRPSHHERFQNGLTIWSTQHFLIYQQIVLLMMDEGSDLFVGRSERTKKCQIMDRCELRIPFLHQPRHAKHRRIVTPEGHDRKSTQRAQIDAIFFGSDSLRQDIPAIMIT